MTVKELTHCYIRLKIGCHCTDKCGYDSLMNEIDPEPTTVYWSCLGCGSETSNSRWLGCCSRECMTAWLETHPNNNKPVSCGSGISTAKFNNKQKWESSM